MTFVRIGLPIAVICPRKAELSAKARQEAGKCFSTFQEIVFGEVEHR
jgi:hypothetical protein